MQQVVSSLPNCVGHDSMIPIRAPNASEEDLQQFAEVPFHILYYSSETEEALH